MTADPKILLTAAAAPSLERIWNDHARAPEALRPFVAFIGDNLFEAKLSVTYLRKEFANGGGWLMGFFSSALGRPPFSYIEDRRMETACRLLRKTDLKVWQIGELLGFKSLQVFSRAFARWSDLRPTVYRRLHGSPDRPFSLDRVAKQAALSVAQLLLRFAEGELSPEYARVLIDRLRDLYPEID